MSQLGQRCFIAVAMLATSCGSPGTPASPTPVLTLTASPDGVALEHATNVTFRLSGGQPGQSYTWDFGDGAVTSAGAVSSHVYSQSGTFTASARPAHGGEKASVSVTVKSLTGTWDLTVSNGDQYLVCTRFSVVLNLVGWASRARLRQPPVPPVGQLSLDGQFGSEEIRESTLPAMSLSVA
jgi:hypothetical protein